MLNSLITKSSKNSPSVLGSFNKSLGLSFKAPAAIEGSIKCLVGVAIIDVLLLKFGFHASISLII